MKRNLNSAKITEERKNEIAYKMLKYGIRKNGNFQGLFNLKRKVPNLLKEPEMQGVEKEEMVEFLVSFYDELFFQLTDFLRKDSPKKKNDNIYHQ